MKKNTKYILSMMIALGLMFLAQSCGDSLGIEDNYSKKLISGKDIKDISYKEYVKITRDTLIFYSDTTIHVDTVHYPVYDSVNSSNQYPTQGIVFDVYTLIYSKFFQAYVAQSNIKTNNVTVNYINNIPIINLNLELTFNNHKNDPIFKYFNELPKSLTIDLRGLTLNSNYYYELSGAKGSGAYGSIVIMNSEGRSLTYEEKNSDLTFYIVRYITAPNDDKKVLYLRGAIMYHSKTSDYMIYNEIDITFY